MRRADVKIKTVGRLVIPLDIGANKQNYCCNTDIDSPQLLLCNIHRNRVIPTKHYCIRFYKKRSRLKGRNYSILLYSAKYYV